MIILKNLDIHAFNPPVYSDLYSKYNTLLVKTDGSRSSNNMTFLDSSHNNIQLTTFGSPSQKIFSPFIKPDGAWSNYFDGSSSLSFSSDSGFDGKKYICLEAWVYFTSVTSAVLFAGRESNYWICYDRTDVGADSGKFAFVIYDGSSWYTVSSTTGAVAGQWYHVVGIKDDTTLRIYINGNQENTSSFSGTPATGAYDFQVGGYTGSSTITGYMSNVRLVTGSSNILPYTSNFTPSTTPLTSVTGTQLLTCQSNRFIDNNNQATAKTIDGYYGSTSVQSFSPFPLTSEYSPSVNGASGYFNGGSDHLMTDVNANLNLGTNNFTLEYWVYFNSTAGDVTALGFGNSADYDPIMGYYKWYYVETLRYWLSSSGGSWDLVGSGGGQYDPNGVIAGYIPLYCWVHVAITRQGNTIRSFYNGVPGWSTNTSSSIYQSANTISIGGRGNGSLVGWISDVRYIKGEAIYTSEFTPPTAPLTAVPGTEFLCNFTNSGVYDITGNYDINPVSGVSVSTSKFKFKDSSIRFDGSSYITLSNNPVNTLGDFTVEGWFYSDTATSVYQCLFSFGGDPGLSSLGTVTFSLGGFNGGSAGSCVSLYTSTDGSSWAHTDPSSSGVISNSVWTHFAVTRCGETMNAYINGNQVITYSLSSTTPLYSGSLDRIGAFCYSNPWNLNGYLQDFRVTNGFARYIGNFVPPDHQLATGYHPETLAPKNKPKGKSDPFFKNVKLLLHGNFPE